VTSGIGLTLMPECHDTVLILSTTGKNADAGLTFHPAFSRLLTEPGVSTGFSNRL
jgi:hypothetical protein